MAVIGGTGSEFGAYRLGAHVLQYAPDLVFVEFAVNDNGKTAQQVKASMKGIVRQNWKYNPKTDICFVYMFQKVQLPWYEKGKFPVSASAMEAVAAHYQIPTVCMGLPAIRLIQAGTLMPPVYASADTSQYLKVSFSGRSLGLLDVMGPSK